MKKNLEIFSKIIIYATFFVPIVVVPSSFVFPFIVPKILLFRGLMTLAIAAYVLLLIINWERYKPRFTWVNLVVGLFLLSFGISTFIGVDWYHSLWDNHERMLGLYTIIHYAALYLIASSVFKNWKEWRTALRIFLIAGSIVMFIGLMQVGDPNLLLNQGRDRVASTLGNSIYVSGYGLFLFFAAFLLTIREKEKGFWFYLQIGMGILAILGTFFGGSRGAMLGMAVGLGFMVVGYAIVLKDYPKTRNALFGVLILGAILVGLMVGFRKSEFVRDIPAIGRTVNTSFEDVKESPRWMAWEIAVKSWTERPVFGWGPNNYFYAFNLYYNPELLEHGYGETWFDNAHNIIMNTLTVQGAFGIISYLAIFGAAIYVLWRGHRRDKLNFHLVVIGSAFLLAHLIQNITVFENPTSYLYFMFWLALINSESERAGNKAEEYEEKLRKDKNLGYGSLSVAGVLALIIIFIFNIQPARANMKTLQAVRIIKSKPSLAIGQMKTALDFNSPHIDDIRSDIARSVSQGFEGIYKNIGIKRAEEIVDLAYKHLRKNLELHPMDVRNHMTLSQLARLKAMINKDAKYMLESEKLLEHALKLSPQRQQIMYSLAAIKMELNKKQEALDLYKQAIEDNPDIGESYWRLAYTYKQMDKMDKAKEVIEKAREDEVEFNKKGERIIDNILTINTTNSKK